MAVPAKYTHSLNTRRSRYQTVLATTMGRKKRKMSKEKAVFYDLEESSSVEMKKKKKSRTTKQRLVNSLYDVQCHQNPKIDQPQKTPPMKPSKKKTQQSAQETTTFELTEPCLSGTVPRRRRTERIDNSKTLIFTKIQKLDSNVFECYLEYLWKDLSEEKKTSFTYLDSLWFNLYRQRQTKAKVLGWIKSKHIFSKKYVFVPLLCWNHWSLLILCHFGESLDSKTRKPCMLLLDSLKMANPNRFEPDIRKFVLDIYNGEGRPHNKKSIAKIPLLVPKVPQQKNGEECGIFVLYFIDLFLGSAPESFDVSEDLPYFLNENWLSTEGLENFCMKVRIFCREKNDPREQWGKRFLDDWNSSTTPIDVE